MYLEYLSELPDDNRSELGVRRTEHPCNAYQIFPLAITHL